jgi:hypothetical protein
MEKTYFKMRNLFFIFIFLILLPFSCAYTLSGSPSSLNYALDIGEEKCLSFNLYSSNYNGNLNSIMKWTEKDAKISSPRDFILNNSEVNLKIDYSPKRIKEFDGNEEIEVCISGKKEGYWRGSLEYKTESSGNIGVGVGTWLRVNIGGVEDPLKKNSSLDKNNSLFQNLSGTSDENIQLEYDSMGELVENEKKSIIASITGAVIGRGGLRNTTFVLGTIVVITALFLLTLRQRNKLNIYNK